ncbi:MerR family transcriptional regulator [Weissella paramesenteroides]|jgi:DNA-binding transcriptional MerR regulator|uniref:MerR family transcriptional regulator n=1 Tax=Weissella paramesenteroides TaxID=1249 RepID=UPI00123AB00C|nr:MerR family transcriptional regulator [Weissella paramesenteroides]KAA8440332.1 MerR family transcriptional regulator [Weissella paramesenteroides]KAA8440612.1 MerR family transcriptional regulator [Weissella paramesenteroides]KAA8440707.1 MerR family transcriptional regulator [Weissella paramesenteroides]KAA8445679.1 MerR family transcriptional regulator [Weissella paramesenteroides]KAA8448511.1 MerR family transcriptional regulator [Weissella paramesenteroides]
MNDFSNSKKYNIGEFSRQFNLPTSTLRYYENEGLIKPQRYPNGRRYYTEEDVSWLKFLNHLKGTGLSIKELKQYIVWREQGDSTIPQRLELLKAAKHNFLSEFSEIQHHLQILNDKINWYEAKQTGIISEDENFAEYLQVLGHHE